jgi:hypothetical protein
MFARRKLRREVNRETKTYRLIITGLAFIVTMNSYSQIDDISDIRNKVFYSEFNLDKSLALIEQINLLDLSDPMVKAYNGASKLLVAKYSWNPLDKISFLRGGIKNINSAVSGDLGNIEIRFLRFYIENSLPKHLGLSAHLIDDKKMIINHLDHMTSLSLTKDIAIFINQYMIDYGNCSVEEISQISNSISRLKFNE